MIQPDPHTEAPQRPIDAPAGDTIAKGRQIVSIRGLGYTLGHDHAQQIALVSVQPTVAAAVCRMRGSSVLDRRLHRLERSSGHRGWRRYRRNRRKVVAGARARSPWRSIVALPTDVVCVIAQSLFPTPSPMLIHSSLDATINGIKIAAIIGSLIGGVLGGRIACRRSSDRQWPHVFAVAALGYTVEHDHAQTRASLVSVQPTVAPAVHGLCCRPVLDWRLLRLDRRSDHCSRRRFGQDRRKELGGAYNRGLAGERRCVPCRYPCLHFPRVVYSLFVNLAVREASHDYRIVDRWCVGWLSGEASLKAIAKGVGGFYQRWPREPSAGRRRCGSAGSRG